MRARRQVLLWAAAAGWAGRTWAQGAATQPVRLGLLHFSRDVDRARYTAAFVAALRQYSEETGRPFAVEERQAANDAANLPGAVRELAATGVQVIVATSTGIDVALAHSALPVVGLGGLQRFTEAQASPQTKARFTGIDLVFDALNLKRLALLAEALPAGSTVVALGAPQVRDSPATQALKQHAQRLGLSLHLRFGLDEAAIDEAVTTALRLKAAGLLMLNHPVLHALRHRVIAKTVPVHLPVMYQWPDSAREGGLMGYGPDLPDMFRQLARLAWRAAQGTPMALLPVEQPARIMLVLNLRAARAIGFRFSPALLARADEVIE